MKVKNIRVGGYTSEEEVEKIIACCIGIRDKAFVAIIYELGARVGEIEDCKIGNVKDHPSGFWDSYF